MSEPKIGNSLETREQLVKFVVMQGELRRTGKGDAREVSGWFVRPEGSRSTNIYHQPEESLARAITDLYGAEDGVDFICGLRASDHVHELAQARAELLNRPDTQERLWSIIDQRKKLEEAIKNTEAKIQLEVEALATILDHHIPEPREWVVKKMDELFE